MRLSAIFLQVLFLVSIPVSQAATEVLEDSNSNFIDQVNIICDTKVTPIILKDNKKTTTHEKPVLAYYCSVSSHSKYKKLQSMLNKKGLSVFICNTSEFFDYLNTRKTSNPVDSLSLVIVKNVAPDRLIRLLSGSPRFDYAITNEMVVNLVKKWHRLHPLRIDCIYDGGVDIEILDSQLDARKIVLELAQFDPYLVVVPETDTVAYKRRIEGMIDYIGSFKIVTLYWH